MPLRHVAVAAAVMVRCRKVRGGILIPLLDSNLLKIRMF